MRQDFSLRFELGRERHGIFEYRLPVANKTYFTAGISYGGKSNYQTNFSGASLATVNDTLIEYRPTDTWQSGCDLRFGIERQLKWPVLSARADLLLGYRQRSMERNSSFVELENGIWMTMTEFRSGPQYADNTALLRSSLLQPGASFSMDLNLPLGTRLLVNLHAAYIVAGNFVYKTDEVSDPLNEFNPQNGANWGLDIDARLGAGLRYKFGEEKVFVRRGEH